ncbi:MAG TPA: formate dehydrogenase subunit delta [Burkholderiaceae bacterium]|jgi:formate dehydrogenase subunit delta|nr:formate dehydrogenase subunit delta [Burkholderiaceae bacterium]
MDAENLIHMANRIGDFFEAYPDRDEACRNIATHLHRFWEPRMRRDLYAQFDRDGAPQLKPIVAEAIKLHRAELNPP